MTQPIPPNSPDPSPSGPAPLSYAAPTTVSPRLMVAQCIVAAMVSAAAVVGAGFALMWAGGFGIFGGPVLAAAVLIVAAVRFRRLPHRRGLAAGIWIGLGVGALTQGVCWYTVSKSIG